VGLGLIAASWRANPTGLSRSVLLELGVETIGLGLTVAIIDWFVEQRRLSGEARRIAWEVYHSIERVAWVWLGGPHQLDADEVIGLLEGVTNETPPSKETESLLYALGVRARQLLRSESEAVAVTKGLRDTLTDLSSFHSLRRRTGTVRPVYLSEVLTGSLNQILKILGLEAEFVPARLIRDRDAGIRSQSRRYRMEARAYTPVPLGASDPSAATWADAPHEGD
jgi:hypothetical protein